MLASTRRRNSPNLSMSPAHLRSHDNKKPPPGAAMCDPVRGVSVCWAGCYRPSGSAAGVAPPPVVGGALGTGAGAGVPAGGFVVPPGRPLGAGGTTTPMSVAGVIVMVIVCVTFPTFAVIVTVPGVSPVTTPFASTVAIAALLVLHVTCVPGSVCVVLFW